MLTAFMLTLKTSEALFVSGWYEPTSLGRLRTLQANLYVARLCLNKRKQKSHWDSVQLLKRESALDALFGALGSQEWGAR